MATAAVFVSCGQLWGNTISAGFLGIVCDSPLNRMIWTLILILVAYDHDVVIYQLEYFQMISADSMNLKLDTFPPSQHAKVCNCKFQCSISKKKNVSSGALNLQHLCVVHTKFMLVSYNVASVNMS